jgi:hypothetical protein
MKKLAAMHFPANVVTLQTFDAVTRLADVYQMPIMAQLIEGMTPKLTAASVLQASGVMSQLDGIVAAFAPQRVALDAIAAAQLAHHNVFRDQMLQILSAQSSISRLVAGGYSTALAPLFGSLGRYGQVQAQLGALTIRPDRTPLLRGNTT